MWKPRSCLVLAGGLLLLLGLMLAPVIQSMRPKKTDLATISQFTGLQFPDDTVLLDSKFKSWIEAEIWAKIQIRRSSLDAFLRESELQISTNPLDKTMIDRYPYTAPPHWWQPQSADRFILGYKSLSEAAIDYVAVLADLDGADERLVLYLHWHRD